MAMEYFDVKESGLEYFRKEYAKLQKKAAKIGCEAPAMMIVGYHFKEEGNRKVKIYEVVIDLPSMKHEGWTFVGRIDRTASNNGRIIHKLNGEEDVPSRFREGPMECNHCNHSRRRNSTYIVRNDANEYLSVGSTCLKEFTGLADANALVFRANMHEKLSGFARGSSEYESNVFYYNVDEYCANVASNIARYGFTSRKVARETNRDSTEFNATLDYDQRFDEYVTASDRETALKAIAWASSLVGRNDFETNIQTIARESVVEAKHLGWATWIVAGYLNTIKKSETKRDTSNSTHQGKIGETLDLDVTVTRRFSTQFNSTGIEMMDGAGNVYLTFDYGDRLVDMTVGSNVKIRAKVKAHNTYNGVRQNQLNFVKKK